VLAGVNQSLSLSQRCGINQDDVLLFRFWVKEVAQHAADCTTTCYVDSDCKGVAVFDKFVEEYEKNLPSSSVAWSSLLPLLAGVQPVRPRQDDFKNLVERFLNKRSDELLHAIDILESHGLLLRSGNLVRIVPDVLADYLLERACINEKGEPTGYATALLEHFGHPPI
jgi:hypothetical protein